MTMTPDETAEMLRFLNQYDYTPTMRESTHVEDRRGASPTPLGQAIYWLSRLGLQRPADTYARWTARSGRGLAPAQYDSLANILAGPEPGQPWDRPSLLDELEYFYGGSAADRVLNTRWYQFPTQHSIYQQERTLPSKIGIPFPPDPNKP